MSPITRLIPDMTLQVLDGGRYQLFNRLGEGSYGAVYRARERIPGTGTIVPRAIKVVPKLRPGKSYGAREVSLHSTIPNHPNVVTLHRAFQSGPFVYLVMDFLDGGDLRTHIGKKHTFSRNDALIKNVFLQMVDGVEAIHRAGVYHRDIKPDNVLVNADMTRVCIGDFGLATTSKESISFNTGSKYYMSPECVDCADELYPYDTSRSDTWALGVVLLNMVAGHIAWEKATLDDPSFRCFLEEEDWLREIFPISEGFNQILRGIFTIVPEEAYSLPELRREIRNLDTFYMTEEELKSASSDARYMWKWYAPLCEKYSSSILSSDSEGGLDSWTSAESSNSLEDDSDDSDESENDIRITGTQLLLGAEEGRLVLPRSLGASQPLPPPISLSSPTSVSSDEFPIRRPATRRAQVAPLSSSHDSAANSSGPPITPETHAQDPPDVVVTDPLEPLVLEGPVLCHGKDSVKERHPTTTRTLNQLVPVRALSASI